MFSIRLKRAVTTLVVMAAVSRSRPAGASGGNDRARPVGLKSDSNEVAVEGSTDDTDDVAASR